MSFLNTAHRAGQGCSDCLSAFSASNSAAIAVGASGTVSPIIFNSVCINQGFSASLGTGYFGATGSIGQVGNYFAPCNGVYIAVVDLVLVPSSATGATGAAGISGVVQLLRNGVPVITVPFTGVNGEAPVAVDFSRILRMCGGQSASVSITNTGDSGFTVAAGSLFEAVRVEKFLRC